MHVHMSCYNVILLSINLLTYPLLLQNTINAVVGTQMEIIKPFWNRTHSDSFYRVWTTSEGSLEIKFKFTLENLPDSFKTEEFRNMYRDEFSLNMATLLNDQLNSDVKLVTKDKTEFCAHKIILRGNVTLIHTCPETQ